VDAIILASLAVPKVDDSKTPVSFETSVNRVLADKITLIATKRILMTEYLVKANRIHATNFTPLRISANKSERLHITRNDYHKPTLRITNC
jgi:hypothetical protein